MSKEYDLILPLYALDPDQTHDLLLADYIHPPILNWLSQCQGFPLAYTEGENNTGILLFDRFTPWGFPWAWNYSIKLFEFFKFIATTKDYKEPWFNGYGLHEQANYGNCFNNIAARDLAIPDSVVITNTTDSPQPVTWLENAFEEDYPISINRNAERGLNSYPFGKIFRKRYTVISPGATERVLFNQFLFCSLVCDERMIAPIQSSLLYVNLDHFLDEFKLIIMQQYPFIGQKLTSLPYTIRLKTHLQARSMGFRDDPNYHPEFRERVQVKYEHEIIPPLFPGENLPEWYHYASLYLANNDFASNGEKFVYQRLGQEIKLRISGDDLYFHVWGNKEIEYTKPAVPVTTQIKTANVNNFATAWFDFYFGQKRYSQFRYRKLEGFNRYNSIFDFEGDLPDFPIYPENFDANRTYYYQWYGLNDHRWIGKSDPRLVKYEYAGISAFHTIYFWLEWQALNVAPIPGTNAETPQRYHLWRDLKYHRSMATVYLNRETNHFNFQFIEAYDGILRADEWEEINRGEPAEVWEDPQANVPAIDWEIDYPFPYSYRWGVWPLAPAAAPFHSENDLVLYIIQEFSRLNDEGESENENMPDSQRIKEIHAALQADKFSTDAANPKNSRVANLGYYIERIGRLLGISVNPDGSIRAIRQAKHLKAGEDLPAGWPIAQWGRNQGGNPKGQQGGDPSWDLDGIAYPVISNTFEKDRFTGEAKAIAEGGHILVQNWPQYMEMLKDDLDKILGGQEAGANILPDPDNPKKGLEYEGLGTLLVEMAYTLTQFSKQLNKIQIASMVNQAIATELIGGLGVPIGIKEVKAIVGDLEVHIPYPALTDKAPRTFDLFVWIMAHLSQIYGSNINARSDLIIKAIEEIHQQNEAK